jgi:protein-tyrosine phosphatase
VRRTFTLRQFERMVTAVGGSFTGTDGPLPKRLATLVEHVNAGRHLVSPVSGDADDLPDPIGKPIDAFRACAQEIWQSLGSVVTVIAGP